jgi:hypothetical protein
LGEKGGEGIGLYQSVELGFRFGKALVVSCVDEEDYAGDFGEVLRKSHRVSHSLILVTTQV